MLMSQRMSLMADNDNNQVHIDLLGQRVMKAACHEGSACRMLTPSRHGPGSGKCCFPPQATVTPARNAHDHVLQSRPHALAQQDIN